MILAIDPGTTQSAWILYNTQESSLTPQIVDKGINENNDLLQMLIEKHLIDSSNVEKLYIEMVASYGMPVGKTVFETCVWIGRFIEAWGGDYEYVYRKDVKMHLCGQTKAKDSNIRQAIMDRHGSTREAAIGTKKNPKALYGVSKDIWAALAVAITASET